VDHGADVGLVHSHTEGNSRDDYIEFATEEIRLALVAATAVQSCMVRLGGEAAAQLAG
jgi:hypothetical protein